MGDTANILLANFGLIMACMICLWVISIPIGDVSFVDSFWAIGFVVVAVSTYLMMGVETQRRLVILVITAIWGFRLGAHLFLRWRREGADGRYVAMLGKSPGNRHWHSLKVVFLTQGPILWLVSLPIQLGQIDPLPAELGLLGYIGVAVAIVGILFETIGDWQLTAFKSDPASHGQVMDRGLWRYTRHPNYFGDACVFWGLFFVAAETSLGKWSVIGPLLLTWTLIKWSGAALLERRMKRSRPGYAEYLQRTSGFLPWPPKKL